VVVLSAILGVSLAASPLKLIATACVVVLGSAFFSCLSMTIAGLALRRLAVASRPLAPASPACPARRRTPGPVAEVGGVLRVACVPRSGGERRSLAAFSVNTTENAAS